MHSNDSLTFQPHIPSCKYLFFASFCKSGTALPCQDLEESAFCNLCRHFGKEGTRETIKSQLPKIYFFLLPTRSPTSVLFCAVKAFSLCASGTFAGMCQIRASSVTCAVLCALSSACEQLGSRGRPLCLKHKRAETSFLLL